jgi:hypothetical protein
MTAPIRAFERAHDNRNGIAITGEGWRTDQAYTGDVAHGDIFV